MATGKGEKAIVQKSLPGRPEFVAFKYRAPFAGSKIQKSREI
jgi:hypothetical protein